MQRVGSYLQVFICSCPSENSPVYDQCHFLLDAGNSGGVCFLFVFPRSRVLILSFLLNILGNSFCFSRN